MQRVVSKTKKVATKSAAPVVILPSQPEDKIVQERPSFWKRQASNFRPPREKTKTFSVEFDNALARSVEKRLPTVKPVGERPVYESNRKIRIRHTPNTFNLTVQLRVSRLMVEHATGRQSSGSVADKLTSITYRKDFTMTLADIASYLLVRCPSSLQNLTLVHGSKQKSDIIEGSISVTAADKQFGAPLLSGHCLVEDVKGGVSAKTSAHRFTHIKPQTLLPFTLAVAEEEIRVLVDRTPSPLSDLTEVSVEDKRAGEGKLVPYFAAVNGVTPAAAEVLSTVASLHIVQQADKLLAQTLSIQPEKDMEDASFEAYSEARAKYSSDVESRIGEPVFKSNNPNFKHSVLSSLRKVPQGQCRLQWVHSLSETERETTLSGLCQLLPRHKQLADTLLRLMTGQCVSLDFVHRRAAGVRSRAFMGLSMSDVTEADELTSLHIDQQGAIFLYVDNPIVQFLAVLCDMTPDAFTRHVADVSGLADSQVKSKKILESLPSSAMRKVNKTQEHMAFPMPTSILAATYPVKVTVPAMITDPELVNMQTIVSAVNQDWAGLSRFFKLFIRRDLKPFGKLMPYLVPLLRGRDATTAESIGFALWDQPVDVSAIETSWLVSVAKHDYSEFTAFIRRRAFIHMHMNSSTSAEPPHGVKEVATALGIRPNDPELLAMPSVHALKYFQKTYALEQKFAPYLATADLREFYTRVCALPVSGWPEDMHLGSILHLVPMQKDLLSDQWRFKFPSVAKFIDQIASTGRCMPAASLNEILSDWLRFGDLMLAPAVQLICLHLSRHDVKYAGIQTHVTVTDFSEYTHLPAFKRARVMSTVIGAGMGLQSPHVVSVPAALALNPTILTSVVSRLTDLKRFDIAEHLIVNLRPQLLDPVVVSQRYKDASLTPHGFLVETDSASSDAAVSASVLVDGTPTSDIPIVEAHHDKSVHEWLVKRTVRGQSFQSAKSVASLKDVGAVYSDVFKSVVDILATKNLPSAVSVLNYSIESTRALAASQALATTISQKYRFAWQTPQEATCGSNSAVTAYLNTRVFRAIEPLTAAVLARWSSVYPLSTESWSTAVMSASGLADQSIKPLNLQTIEESRCFSKALESNVWALVGLQESMMLQSLLTVVSELFRNRKYAEAVQLIHNFYHTLDMSNTHNTVAIDGVPSASSLGDAHTPSMVRVTQPQPLLSALEFYSSASLDMITMLKSKGLPPPHTEPSLAVKVLKAGTKAATAALVGQQVFSLLKHSSFHAPLITKLCAKNTAFSPETVAEAFLVTQELLMLNETNADRAVAKDSYTLALALLTAQKQGTELPDMVAYFNHVHSNTLADKPFDVLLRDLNQLPSSAAFDQVFPVVAGLLESQSSVLASTPLMDCEPDIDEAFKILVCDTAVQDSSDLAEILNFSSRNKGAVSTTSRLGNDYDSTLKPSVYSLDPSTASLQDLIAHLIIPSADGNTNKTLSLVDDSHNLPTRQLIVWLSEQGLHSQASQLLKLFLMYSHIDSNTLAPVIHACCVNALNSDASKVHLWVYLNTLFETPVTSAFNHPAMAQLPSEQNKLSAFCVPQGQLLEVLLNVLILGRRNKELRLLCKLYKHVITSISAESLASVRLVMTRTFHSLNHSNEHTEAIGILKDFNRYVVIRMGEPAFQVRGAMFNNLKK